jgi:hypothetical protein
MELGQTWTFGVNLMCKQRETTLFPKPSFCLGLDHMVLVCKQYEALNNNQAIHLTIGQNGSVTMPKKDRLTSQEIAIRAHDITVCLERASVADFDELTKLGMAVRLALHLRGVPAVPYSLLKDVAVHLLDFPAVAVRPVLELLDEAEFVKLDTEGKTIKTVIPDVPFFEDLFSKLGDAVGSNNFSEPDMLTLLLVQRLANSPMLIDHAYDFGAERTLVDKIIGIGTEGSFIVSHRARGRSVLLSPVYFPENSQAYADLVAAGGSQRVKNILELLKNNQGWPLGKIIGESALSDVPLDEKDIAIIKMLAGDGFVPPPAIQTTHSGTNHFLFGPRPSMTRLPAYKRPVYEAAMALVAAVRQGQLLPARYAIRSPWLLLSSFKEKGYLKANTEAIEQYKQVCALRVGRLEMLGGDWAKLVLIDLPENHEAVDMALELVSGSEPPVAPNEEIILSLRGGEKYLESLIGRKKIVDDKVITLDEESRAAVDSFLLRAR